MNYEEALSYIHGTLKFGVKLGLKNMETLLSLMGNPQNKLRYVHVGGTNGKGSTVTFISSILIEAGYKTGIYTSPYIERFTERIRINSTEITREGLARITGFVKEKVDIMISRGENHPTEFEIVTAIAFQYFYEMNCDVVVLEVGLGGRFDSTNVIKNPLVSVITTISYDHMAILGDTLGKIAIEKAGIIKEDSDVVVYPQSEEVMRVFLDVCEEKNSKLHRVGFQSVRIVDFSLDGQKFSYKKWKDIRTSLLGEHQVKNAVLAIEAVEILKQKGYSIPDYAIEKGLFCAKWPGRLEVLNKRPVFLIDGAHNREGAAELAKVLKAYFPGKKILFLIGVLKDKEVKSIIEPTLPLASGYITLTPESDRALPSEDLANFVLQYCKNVLVSDTIVNAIKTSFEHTTGDDIICAYGSLYYIGKVRSFFKS